MTSQLNTPPAYSHYAFQDARRRKFYRKPSAELATKRRNDARYEGLGNTCPRCFIVKAVATGICGCP
jgi:hypothetical protein